MLKTSNDLTMETPGQRLKIGAIIALVFVAVNLIGLDRSPTVGMDEVICNDPARELALHGRYHSTFFEDFQGKESTYFFLPPGQPLVVAATYRLFGFGIWQTRVPTLLFAGAALSVFYLLARRLLVSSRAALFATLLLALDPKYIQASRSGRMDMEAIFFILSGLVLYFNGREGTRRSPLFLGGFLIGLGGITHPIASFFAAALGLVILIDDGPRRWRNLFIVGPAAALAPAAWVGAGLLLDPEGFIGQFWRHGLVHLPQLSIMGRFTGELARYPQAYRLTPLLLIIYFVSFGWLLGSKTAPRRLKLNVAVFFFTLFTLNSLVFRKVGAYYYLYTVIFLAPPAGLMLDRFLPRPIAWAGRRAQKAALALAALLLANVLAGGIFGRWVALSLQWEARDYRRLSAELKSIVPPGSLVGGPPQAWLAVIEADAILHYNRNPTPELYDFAIFNARQVAQPAGFAYVATIGEALPQLVSWYAFTDNDYRLQVWRSTVRTPKAPAGHKPRLKAEETR